MLLKPDWFVDAQLQAEECGDNRAFSRYSVLPQAALNSISLLGHEKWNAKIFAVFQSFVYRIDANWTLSKLASSFALLFEPMDGYENANRSSEHNFPI